MPTGLALLVDGKRQRLRRCSSHSALARSAACATRSSHGQAKAVGAAERDRASMHVANLQGWRQARSHTLGNAATTLASAGRLNASFSRGSPAGGAEKLWQWQDASSAAPKCVASSGRPVCRCAWMAQACTRKTRRPAPGIYNRKSRAYTVRPHLPPPTHVRARRPPTSHSTGDAGRGWWSGACATCCCASYDL